MPPDNELPPIDAPEGDRLPPVDRAPERERQRGARSVAPEPRKATALVRVTNKKPRLLHLPDLIEAREGRGGEPRITGIGTGKSLNPGGNNVDAQYWRRVKEHKEVASWIDLGWLVEGGDTSRPEGVDAPASLTGYGVTAAITIVEGETNRETLKRWLDAEKRPEVIAALRGAYERVGGQRG